MFRKNPERTVIFLATLLSLTSCKDNSTNPPPEQSLVGWWRGVDEHSDEEALTDTYFHFEADGYYSFNQYDEVDDTVNCLTPLGRYEIVENRLLLQSGPDGTPIETWYFRIESFGALGADRLYLYEREDEPDEVYYANVRIAAAPAPFVNAYCDESYNDRPPIPPDTLTVTAAGVAGAWSALSWLFVSDADSAEQVDLLVELNASATLTIAETARYALTLILPGQVTSMEVGSIRAFANGTLKFDPDDDAASTASFVLSDGNNRLTLTFRSTEYDFDGDGRTEPANATLVLIRT